MIEVEVKFKISDIKNLRKALRKIGAKRVGKVLQQDIAFDDRKETLMRGGKLLRLRRAGDEVYLTFKSRKRGGRFKEAEEVEVRVDDFDRATEILKALGFHPKRGLEKLRERWDFKNSKILIDQSALGKFLEIEGNKDEIEKIIELLNLNPKDRTTKTYLEIYQEYCKKKGMKPHPRFIVMPR